MSDELGYEEMDWRRERRDRAYAYLDKLLRRDFRRAMLRAAFMWIPLLWAAVFAIFWLLR